MHDIVVENGDSFHGGKFLMGIIVILGKVHS